MTDVAFHFGAPDKVAYAVRLLRKAVGTGARVVVVADLDTLERLDAALWASAPTDFLTHCWVNATGAAALYAVAEREGRLASALGEPVAERVAAGLAEPEAVPESEGVGEGEADADVVRDAEKVGADGSAEKLALALRVGESVADAEGVALGEAVGESDADAEEETVREAGAEALVAGDSDAAPLEVGLGVDLVEFGGGKAPPFVPQRHPTSLPCVRRRVSQPLRSSRVEQARHQVGEFLREASLERQCHHAIHVSVEIGQMHRSPS